MKTLFVHAKQKEDVSLSKEALSKLPKQIYGLVTTIQHMYQLRKIQDQLKNSVFGGQVLGCRADAGEKIKDKVDAFLYVGTGVFHPIKVALQTSKDVFCWNPLTKKLSKLDEKEINNYKNRIKGSLIKFFSSKNIGVLITLKVGQNENKISSNKSSKLPYSKQLEKLYPDKNYYYFVGDTFSTYDLENFNFIDCWVNTACSRIADEKPNMVNMEDIVNSLNL